MGRSTYIKGVTVRFDFDAIRISQIQRLVKNKATGTPYGMSIHFHVGSARVGMVVSIPTSAWGFRRCSFGLIGQCESLYSVERVTETGSTFFFCTCTTLSTTPAKRSPSATKLWRRSHVATLHPFIHSPAIRKAYQFINS